jgi:hypothetical protein
VNLVSFFHRLLGPAPPIRAEYRQACDYPIEQRYWSPCFDDAVHARRWARKFDPPMPLTTTDEDCTCSLEHSGAAAFQCNRGQWLWTVWVTLSLDLPADNSTPTAQRFLSRYHLWAPNFPGDRLPLLGDPDGQQLTMRELLPLHLPDDVPWLPTNFDNAVFDQRLGVFAMLSVPRLPTGEALRSLLDIDPATGMEAPSEWTERWLAGRLYDRWATHGVLWGFTHHSALLLHAGQDWLGSLCRPAFPPDGPRNQGAYFDLALLAFSEMALAVVAAQEASAGDPPAKTTVAKGLSTPIDQGRALLDCWRAAYRRDLSLVHG